MSNNNIDTLELAKTMMKGVIFLASASFLGLTGLYFQAIGTDISLNVIIWSIGLMVLSIASGFLFFSRIVGVATSDRPVDGVPPEEIDSDVILGERWVRVTAAISIVFYLLGIGLVGTAFLGIHCLWWPFC